MSQENVEIVRRYFEAVERVFAAYWQGPRSLADSLRAGEVRPELADAMRYLHPNIEWKSALIGITTRGYEGTASWCRSVSGCRPGLPSQRPRGHRSRRQPSSRGGATGDEGKGKRHRRQRDDLLDRHRGGRPDHPIGRVSGTRRGPRSRRPLGVGDVAGERGDRARPPSRRGTRGTWMPFVSCTTPTSSCGRRRVGRSRGLS